MNMYKKWRTYRRGCIRILLLVLAGLMSLGQLQKIQLTNVSALYYHDFVILAVVVLSFPFLQNTWKWIIQKDWVRWFVRFVGIVAITLALAYMRYPVETW
ncbi:MAG: hypothetical protein AAB612_04300, partial [Patescibacteria group bacterium]